MANTREILSRIKSIKDTMKITNAMYMIASSKVKKARKDLEKTEPYFFTLQTALSKMLNSIDDTKLKNKFFDKRDYKSDAEKIQGYIVVTADKGLASAYNHNVIKLAEQKIKNDSTMKLYVIGQVGRNYFSKRGIKIDAMFNYTAQNPSVNRSRAIAERVIEYFVEGEIDELFIIYTKLNNSANETVEIQKLLPLEKEDMHKNDNKYQQEVVLYPDPETVINQLAPSYLSGFIYGALMEAYCSENNARMMAMKNATDAAKDMIKNLNMAYNRARQAAITQEITEIVSGAKALQNKDR